MTFTPTFNAPTPAKTPQQEDMRGASNRARSALERVNEYNEQCDPKTWQKTVIDVFKNRKLTPREIQSLGETLLQEMRMGARYKCHSTELVGKNGLNIWHIYTTPARLTTAQGTQLWHKPYMMPRGLGYKYDAKKQKTGLFQRIFPLGFDSAHIDERVGRRDGGIIDYKSAEFADLTGLSIFMATHMEHTEEIMPAVFPHTDGLLIGNIAIDPYDITKFSNYTTQELGGGSKNLRVTNGKNAPLSDDLIQPKRMIFVDTFFGKSILNNPKNTHLKSIRDQYAQFFNDPETRQFLRRITGAFLKSDKVAWNNALEKHPDVVAKIEGLVNSDAWSQLRLGKDQQEQIAKQTPQTEVSLTPPPLPVGPVKQSAPPDFGFIS